MDNLENIFFGFILGFGACTLLAGLLYWIEFK